MERSLQGAQPVLKREAVVWRWKGYRPDIVRIAKGVIAATGAGGAVAEIVDAMGKSDFRALAEFEQAVANLEKFNTLVIVSGADHGPCRIAVVFDAAGVHSTAAVTVITSGTDPAAVDRGHARATQLVAAGAREPKSTEPSQVEQWGVIAAVAAIAGGLLGLVFGESDGGMLLLSLALAVAGVVGMAVSLGYENLVPRVELLRSGQTPRLHKFALWVSGAIGAALLGSLVTGVLH